MPGKKSEIWNELTQLANEAYLKHHNFDEITEILMQRHNDEPMVYAIVKKLKSDHYAKQRKEGTILLLIGLGLILTGFLITCFNFHSNRSFTFAMYGLTSIGLGVVFYALYKIIG